MAVAPADPALAVRRAPRLRGEPGLPGDKSVSHRALLLALLAAGETRIAGAGDGRDVRATAAVVAALGATVERAGDDPRAVDYRVVSPGRGGLREPEGILDCENSGTTFRLVAGILAGLPLFAILDGDGSLRRRPMGRVAGPLAAMGATIAGRAGATLPPLAIGGRARLAAIDHATPVPSAQVKSAILLAGLAAEGTTTVREAVATRDHTERMLRARGVAVRTETLPGGGAVHALDGPAGVAAVDQRVPGDVSAAAFWLVAGAIHPDAELTLRGVGTNPTRRAIIDLLRRMGADIVERPVAGADAAGIDPSAPDRARQASRSPTSSSGAARSGGSTWRPRRSPRRSTRSRCSAWPPRRRPGAPSSGASASCDTRNRTASPASRPGSPRWEPGSRSPGTRSRSTGAGRCRARRSPRTRTIAWR